MEPTGKQNGRKTYVMDRLDRGLLTRLPASSIPDNYSPNAKNFDPQYEGGVRKRKGFAKFTATAKSSPTGSFVSGLFGATTQQLTALKVWSVDAGGGPAFVDETTDFNDADAADVNPFPVTEATDDYFAIGLSKKFQLVQLNISTAGVGGVVVWEYYNGSAWASLSGLTDNTTNLTVVGVNNVDWTVPSDWAKVNLNSSTLYYVRAKITTVYNTNPVITQGLLGTGRTYVLAAEGTKLHDITDENWDTTIGSVTFIADTPIRMDIHNDNFLICNTGGGPYKWTGGDANAAALGGSPPSNATLVAVHKNRVWLFPKGSTGTYSALDDTEDYTTLDNAGSQPINTADGMEVNGVISGGDFLLISKTSPASDGKEGKLYVVFGNGPFDFVIKKIADIGAFGQESMVSMGTWVAVATPAGVVGIQGRKKFNLSDNIDPSNEYVTGYYDIANPKTIALGTLYSLLKVAHPAGSGTSNDQVFVLDVERGVWGLDTGPTPRQYARHPDGRLLFGGAASVTVFKDGTGTNDDSAAIDFFWETPDLDFGDWTAAKRLALSHIHAKNTGSYAITQTIFQDQTTSADGYSDTMNVSTEKPVKKMKQFPNKRAKFWRVRWRNAVADQDITIYKARISAEVFASGSK